MLNERRDVYILLFPVKPRVSATRRALALALFSAACGYSPAHSALENTRWCALAGTSLVPDADAVTAALEGARAELARHGALASNGEYPCLHVELTRVREAPRGIQAAQGQPVARGISVEATGRAWLQNTPDAQPVFETGELSRIGRAAAGDTALDNDRPARLQASRNLGVALVRSALGLPTPKREPEDLP